MTNYTPMLRQYLNIKQNYQDCILFFRLGDFYEMFFDDARYAAETLGIVLTARDGGKGTKVPMCGVPFHSADNYIQKLLAVGQKVAICEQVEDVALSKGLVKRDVVRVITPGTMTNLSFLDADQNNYLFSIHLTDQMVGLSVVDVSTGYFSCSELHGENIEEQLIDEFQRQNPREILTNQPLTDFKALQSLIENQDLPYSIVEVAEWTANDYRHIDATAIPFYSLGRTAAGTLLQYLKNTQAGLLGRITLLQPLNTSAYMRIDAITKRNLELTETMRDNRKRGSLFWLLDEAVTPLGSRMIRNWILKPLLSIEQIQQRQQAVEELIVDAPQLAITRQVLAGIGDIERLIGKIAVGSANAKDVRELINSLKETLHLHSVLVVCESSLLTALDPEAAHLMQFIQEVDCAIALDPPNSLRDGGMIADHYHAEIDHLRDLQRNGQSWIAALEASERQKTGIKNLKIGFNKVFGYYLEITKSNIDLAPDYYIRKQTLSNSERYVTPELKQKEEDILLADEKLKKLELEVFQSVITTILGQVYLLQTVADRVARIDALTAFAYLAQKNSYNRPEVNDSKTLSIVESRHPVIEQVFARGTFVPNDIQLHAEDFFQLITGPNMSGKSTYMRQIALVILMAQIGSYVPAKQATIGVVDRLFTRVGASDDIFSGHSTFMVEMQEVANICRHATAQSFIILDEIGRGTSTYDGMSIARAVSEFLYKLKCRVLFATHYHELTDLADIYPGLTNHSVAVYENGHDIVFLHKIIAGPSNRSYGIHVCKLADIPESIITRAQQYLTKMENEAVVNTTVIPPRVRQKNASDIEKRVAREIAEVELQHITPFNALTYIMKWQEELRKESQDE